MSGVNKVILAGYVGSEPEHSLIGKNTYMLSLSLVTEQLVTKDDKCVVQAEWHKVIIKGDLAKEAALVINKGINLYVEGKCKTRSYFDKERVKRYVAEIIVDKYQIMHNVDTHAVVDTQTVEP